jgi:hypothetical protein
MAASENMLELILQCLFLTKSYIAAPLMDNVILSSLLFYSKCTSLQKTFQINKLSVSEEVLFLNKSH